MRSILLSGQLWGRRPFAGRSPFAAVQAYTGELPTDDDGFEFWTYAAPDPNNGPVAYWRRYGRQDGLVMLDNDETVAKIDILITRVTLTQLP